MTKTPALTFILTTILIDAIGVGVIFPLMPDLMVRLGMEDTATGAVWGGVLLAAFALSQFVFSPIIGGLSDAIGRKPVLLFAMATLVVDYTMMALATSFWIILIARSLAGVAGATYVTATAYLADISPPEKRAANFGLIGATFGVGFVLGPAIGGLLAGVHVTAPFWFAAGLAAANVLLGLVVLPESLAPDKRRPFSEVDLNPFRAIIDALRLPALRLPLIALFLFEFANMVYPTLWAFWGREVFGWSAAIIGLTLAAYGIGIAITQGLILPLGLRRFGEHRTLVIGIVAGIVSCFAFGLTGQVWVVFIALPIACLSDTVPPTITGIMSNATDERRQGLLQGVIASLGSVAAILSPLLMTPLFRAFAGDDAALHLPGMPFLVSGVIGFVILAMVFRLRSQAGMATKA